MFNLQPELDELDIAVHSRWQQQVVPWYGFFSSPDYPSQIPTNIQNNTKLITKGNTS
jgi:hypothetical protein